MKKYQHLPLIAGFLILVASNTNSAEITRGVDSDYAFSQMVHNNYKSFETTQDSQVMRVGWHGSFPAHRGASYALYLTVKEGRVDGLYLQLIEEHEESSSGDGEVLKDPRRGGSRRAEGSFNILGGFAVASFDPENGRIILQGFQAGNDIQREQDRQETNRDRGLKDSKNRNSP